jgi:hypothetical protein
MKFVPLKYRNDARPAAEFLLPVTGRRVLAVDGETVPVPEQDADQLLKSPFWSKPGERKDKKNAPPELETRPATDIDTRADS